MKNTYYALLIALTFIACSKDDDNNENACGCVSYEEAGFKLPPCVVGDPGSEEAQDFFNKASNEQIETLNKQYCQ